MCTCTYTVLSLYREISRSLIFECMHAAGMPTSATRESHRSGGHTSVWSPEESRSPKKAGRPTRGTCSMSFICFVPGRECIGADAFRQASDTHWIVDLMADTPINELVCYISQPLAQGQALGCHVAAAPFDKWHYLGPITNGSPSAVFKTRYVWSAADAIPTHVQFGVSLEPESSLARVPPEKASSEVLEAGRRIGQDLYQFISSFAVPVQVGFESKIQLPSNVLNKWLTRFHGKCQREGLDWLKDS